MWRIYSYFGQDGSTNNIKLVYSQSVVLNNDYTPILKEKKTDFKDYKLKIDGEVKYAKKKYLEYDENDSFKITNCLYDKRNSIYYFKNGLTYNGINHPYKYYRYYNSTSDGKLLIPIDISDEYELLSTTNVECTKPENIYNYSQFSHSSEDDGEYNDGTIKYDLYNSIIHKDWIENYPYYTSYKATDKMNAKIAYGSVSYDKLGVLDIEEFNDSILIGKTWLEYYKSTPIGSLDYSGRYLVFPNTTFAVWTEKNSEYKGDVFIPVITLKSGVKIEKDDTCSNPGSISCPYVLSFDGVKTSD